MALLDRDRMPVRFTLVTSVTSGLILAAILGVLRLGIAPGTTLMWFALTLVGSAAVSWVAASTLLRIRKQSKRAFLITSAFNQKYYLAALVQRLHSALDRNGIDLVLKVPDRDQDYDASAQSHHLSRVLDRHHDYIGGIIVASEMHRLREDLTTFCRRSRLPVVFTDVEPFDNESEYPENTAFVGYDTGELGELAGRWLAKHLQGQDSPHVLIIASHEHNARQQRCEQTLRSALPDITITIDDECEFKRSSSYKAVRAHLRQLRPHQRLDAIFCTNDEMALGAVDALSPPAPATQATVVVGVDGVLEATALIDTADNPLRATIVQDIDRLAGAAVDILEKMHRGRTIPKRTILQARIHEAGPT
jgi:ribose transport system substrate-binding protein